MNYISFVIYNLFLSAENVSAQINAKWLYEIILKFKYLAAASIGMKSFSQTSFTFYFRFSLAFLSAVK